jgi:hypothetical protein
MTPDARTVRLVPVLVLAVALVAVLFAGGGQRGLASHVPPIFVPGSATCPAGTIDLRVEPVTDGTFSDGTLTVTIDARDTAEGQVVDWTANIGVDAVIARGGPDSNLYLYSPEATADTGLHAPVNLANGQYFGLTSISFCYGVAPPTNTPTSTPTNTPTNTPTDTPTNTPTDTPTDTPTNTPTDTPTNTPTNTPTDTPTNTPTDTPTNTPTDTPTNTPTDTPTNTPTKTPTNTPTPKPGCVPSSNQPNKCAPAPTRTPRPTKTPRP